MKQPYTLKKRPPQKIYYYKLSHQKTYHTTGQRSKARAQEYVLSLISGDAHGTSEQTVNDFTSTLFLWEQCSYLRRQDKKGRPFSKFTAQMRRGHLVNHVWKAFGSREIRSLRTNEIDEWLMDLPLANRTKNHILGTIKIVFDEAARDGIIANNPTESIDRFPDDSVTKDIFTSDELSMLFPEDNVALREVWKSEMWAALFYIIATTGMRLGEARALTWGDWHEQKSILHVHRAVKNDESIGKTKNGEERPVPVIPRLAELLGALRELSSYNGDSDLIICSAAGKVLDRSTCARHFKKALKICNIDDGSRILTTHSLRHTANTRYRRIIEDKHLRVITGHKDEKMTDLYDHPTLEDEITLITPYMDSINGLWEQNAKAAIGGQ